MAEDKGVEEMLAFATSAIRDAPNGEAVLDTVRAEAGVDLQVLSGEDEARLTFFAVRRWYGWSSGRLLVLDIGGGSLEVATGPTRSPTRRTRCRWAPAGSPVTCWTVDPPDPDAVAALRKHVRAVFARDLGRVIRVGAPDRVVGTSKTFRSLARMAGAAPSDDGPYVRRVLRHQSLLEWVPKMATMSAAERAELPGVSPGRAQQLLAGAVVADAAMDLLGVEELEICPWALREGVILRRLDQLATHEPSPTPGGRHPSDRRLVRWRLSRVPGRRGRSPSGSLRRAWRCRPRRPTPRTPPTAFELAARLGYDGLELMVGTDPVSQEVEAVRRLVDHYGVPVLAIHSPCLLITQRVWTSDPWVKLERSRAAAEALGASTVVVHPPFRWQREYAQVVHRRGWPGWRRRRTWSSPSRTCTRGARPAGRRRRTPPAGTRSARTTRTSRWTCRTPPSRAATRSRWRATLGDRLAHLHLADGSGSNRDEHLVPGRGTQPCTDVLELLAGNGFAGTVVLEVSTRRAANRADRESDLAEALAFARLNLAAASALPLTGFTHRVVVIRQVYGGSHRHAVCEPDRGAARGCGRREASPGRPGEGYAAMDPRLAHSCRLRGGVFTRADALAAGYSPAEIVARLRRGAWRTVRRGVYAAAAAVTGRRGRTWRQPLAVLPARAALSHRSAAVLHGLPARRYAGTRRGGDHRRRPSTATSGPRGPRAATAGRPHGASRHGLRSQRWRGPRSISLPCSPFQPAVAAVDAVLRAGDRATRPG